MFFLAALAACSSERSRTDVIDCPTWVEDIGPAVSDRCATCHGGDTPSGSYDLTSYKDALGVGTDSTPNLIAGDASSALLAAIDPATANAVHADFSDLHAVARTWVTECDIDYFDSPLHPGGIMNPTDPAFHGTQIRDSGYDFELCAGCHGEDFSGGKAQASCLTCHENGPTDCGTCHDTPPRDLAHQTHGNGGNAANGFDCTECHVVPTEWDDVGHVLLADGTVDSPPADVAFGAIAKATPAGYTRDADPVFDPIDKRCSNVYCHGGVLGDSSATNTTPVWNGTDQATCGSCHGLPPSSHASDQCATCHPRAFTAAGPLAKDTHIDLMVQVGKTGSGCNDCHGTGADGAPPTDLSGNTATTALGVGAHQAHVTGLRRLTAPLACSACHLAPTDIDSVGHIDSAAPAEVFPGGAAFGGVAARMNAVPTWDRATATCSDVLCHGGGNLEAGAVSTPVWTAVGQLNQTFCGSCHPVPPTSGVHIGKTLADCTNCHSSIGADGLPIITGPPGAETSEHIDGNLTF